MSRAVACAGVAGGGGGGKGWRQLSEIRQSDYKALVSVISAPQKEIVRKIRNYVSTAPPCSKYSSYGPDDSIIAFDFPHITFSMYLIFHILHFRCI